MTFMQKDQWEAGRLIQQARESRGITKRGAAKAIGRSESWWRKMEMGSHSRGIESEDFRPTAESLATAARSVGLSPSYILQVGGYAEEDIEDPATMRESIHVSVDEFDDAQLPAIKGFLEGLRTGMGMNP